MILASTLALALAAAPRSTEAFFHDDAHLNAVRVTAELDPALALGVGYVRMVPLELGGFSRRLGLHADVTTILGGSSWDLTSGFTLPLFAGGGFNALVSADLQLKLAQNDVHTALVSGYGAALQPGYFGRSWYVTAEASLRGTIAASFFHSAAVRAELPGLVDGTYRTRQLAFFFGGAAGVQVLRTVIIGLRFAWRVPYTFESYAPWVQPYTLNVELGWRF